MAARAVTRSDVARYAQVSSAVVSYVVNGGPKRVAPATERRVREAVELLGYRPNLNARALKRGVTEMIGFVLPDSSNPFFAEFAHAIEVAATERGHALIMANSDYSTGTETQLIRDLAGRQVDGVLVATTGRWSEGPGVQGGRTPILVVNSEQAVPGQGSIGPNFFQGGRDATQHLIEVHGYTSVAMTVGDIDRFHPNSREAGYLDAVRSAGLSDGMIARVSFSRAGGYAAGQRMLGQERRGSGRLPRAIFTSSDQQAIGLLRAIREGGLRVPEDIALVSFDGTSESEYCWPPLTVIRQPIWAMAVRAVETILDPQRSDEHQMFDLELVVRRSCGCLSSPSEVEREADVSVPPY